MSDLKVKDLKGFTDEQLQTQLKDLKENLVSLRAKKDTVRSGEIVRARKSIARILTIINLKARQQVRESITDPKTLPKDLRPKLTRALRRKLTASEAGAKTLRQQKKSAAFPKRQYALKN